LVIQLWYYIDYWLAVALANWRILADAQANETVLAVVQAAEKSIS
jgi:hypothetical protein